MSCLLNCCVTCCIEECCVKPCVSACDNPRIPTCLKASAVALVMLAGIAFGVLGLCGVVSMDPTGAGILIGLCSLGFIGFALTAIKEIGSSAQRCLPANPSS
jgi:hypothetical protein